ncbi:MAG: RNA 2',3'-cyclic phosphodiesterase [bacterium]
MGTQRLFIGTSIPEKLIAKHYDEIQSKFNEVCTGKWVEPNNMHFTYKFLGNVEEDLIPDIKDALGFALTKYDAPIYLNSLRCMPNAENPKILYTSIFSPGLLVHKIYERIEDVVTTKFDIKPEFKKYMPHMTLCRIKETTPQFQKHLEEWTDFRMGHLKFFRVNLYSSQLTQEGPIYKIIE